MTIHISRKSKADRLPALRDFSKPWLSGWLDRLAELKPTSQAIGVWLAAQADESGVIDDLDKAELARLAGVHLGTVKRELSPGSELIASGLVTRRKRRYGAAYAATLYRLNVG